MTDITVEAMPFLLRALAGVRRGLQDVRDVQPVFLSGEAQAEALLELTRIEAQVAELKLRVVAAAAEVADDAGCRDVAAWLATRTRASVRSSRAVEALAGAVDARYPMVAAGMADGAVSLEQAQVVVGALDALPGTLEPDVVSKAQAQLVAWCADFRPEELRRLGRRLLEVVAPEIAEEIEARRLADAERAAWERTRLSLHPVGDGTTRLSAVLPDQVAERLRTYLEAFTSPRHAQEVPAGRSEGDRIPYARKLGHALCALLEHLDPDKLPAHGGDATTVMVTITLDALRRDLAVAGVIGSETSALADLSAAEARRLACTAEIVPVVLGGKGTILDLGRSQRLFNAAQRKALRLRDQRCRAEGCTVPATWCEAHHVDPWHAGGKTDLDAGVLLCSYHHHRAHDPGYEHERLASGDYRIRKVRRR